MVAFILLNYELPYEACHILASVNSIANCFSKKIMSFNCDTRMMVIVRKLVMIIIMMMVMMIIILIDNTTNNNSILELNIHNDDALISRG